MISSHVTYAVGRARIDDLRSEADERRRAVSEPHDSDRPARVGHRPYRSRQPLHALRLRRA